MDPFDDDTADYESWMEGWAGDYLTMFNDLEANTSQYPILFRLTTEQRTVFNQRFQDRTRSLPMRIKHWGALLYRMGLIAYRIAMIFSTIRAYSDKVLFESLDLVCTDIDFYNALDNSGS